MLAPATSITRVHESARLQHGAVTAPLPPGGAVAGPAIETHGLTKRYGTRTAVDGLDIEVPRGVIAGFVGPNAD
jgi:ATPase subunit of ABC transporter with duplicated ATPase domains